MNNELINYFISLIQIDSESKNEKLVAVKLAEDLKTMGAEVRFDNANEHTGGNVGNLHAFFPGKGDKEPILFCAHMDTVTPGNGIKPMLTDGKIFTDGTTILGSDDKSGIAQIIWGIKELQKEQFDYAPIEILFTISEEIGLLGAKYCDYSMLKSKFGYALDSHIVGHLMSGAPSQNDITIRIKGKSSHAGVAPDKGVNAIKIAAEAIAKMPSGRIDEETTCNVGKIKGGTATNIVPNLVELEAEVRSHDNTKLDKITDQIIDSVNSTISDFKAKGIETSTEIDVHKAYKTFRIDQQDRVIKIAKKAAQNLDISFAASIGGGGSDANMFNDNGMMIAVAGTGMNNVHTVDEFIKIEDLEMGMLWVKEIIKIHSTEV